MNVLVVNFDTEVFWLEESSKHSIYKYPLFKSDVSIKVDWEVHIRLNQLASFPDHSSMILVATFGDRGMLAAQPSKRILGIVLFSPCFRVVQFA